MTHNLRQFEKMVFIDDGPKSVRVFLIQKIAEKLDFILARKLYRGRTGMNKSITKMHLYNK